MKPILFNTDMIRAILDGRKSVTRRVVKPQPRGHAALLSGNILPETEEAGAGRVYAFEDGTVTSSPYRPGDILYVRETWQVVYETEYAEDGEGVSIRDAITNWDQIGKVAIGLSRDNAIVGAEARMKYYVFKADAPEFSKKHPWDKGLCWRPSIHMPKEAARLFLRVKKVWVERLWDITEEQAEKEGLFRGWSLTEHSSIAVSARQAFMWTWDSTIKKADCGRYGWAANPWVWVIEFEQVSEDWALRGGQDNP